MNATDDIDNFVFLEDIECVDGWIVNVSKILIQSSGIPTKIGKNASKGGN